MDSETNSSILWFEYLLDSTLLEKQLQQANSGLCLFTGFIFTVIIDFLV